VEETIKISPEGAEYHIIKLFNPSKVGFLGFTHGYSHL